MADVLINPPCPLSDIDLVTEQRAFLTVPKTASFLSKYEL